MARDRSDRPADLRRNRLDFGPRIRVPSPDESTRSDATDRSRRRCDAKSKGDNSNRHDSTVAESVAVDSRKQNNLPDRRIGRVGPHGPAGFVRGSWRMICKHSECCCWRQRPPATDSDTATLTSGSRSGFALIVVSSSRCHGRPAVQRRRAGRAAAACGAANGRRFTVTKSQIYFLDPNGMQIGWQTGAGPNGERTYLPAQLTVPARYNFNQGYIYRLKITNIPGDPRSPSTRRSRSPRRPRRPTPTWPTTQSRCSSPPKTSTRWSTAATS